MGMMSEIGITNIGWFILALIQIAVGILFFYRYNLDKDKRKLMFGLAFFVIAYSHFYETFIYFFESSDFSVMFQNIQYWTFYPLVFAIGVATHQRNLKHIHFTTIFNSFLILSIALFPLIVLNPIPAKEYAGLLAILIGIEIILASLLNNVKDRDPFNFSMLLANICYIMGGASLSLGNGPNSIFAFFLGNLLILFMFLPKEISEKNARSNISSYFNIQKKLSETTTQLQKATEKYERLTDTLPVGVLVIDKFGRITYANPESQKIFNVPFSKSKGTSFSKYMTNASRKKSIKLLRKVKTGKNIEKVEFEAVHQDGHIFPVEVWATPLKKEGKYDGLLCVVRDITERKESEKNLKESEEKFRSLVEQAAEMLFLHDINGQILDVNLASEKNTGYSKKELLQMTIFDVDPDAKNRNDMQRYWRQLRPDDPPRTFEVRHKRKNGTIYHAEATVSKVVLTDGEYILGLVRDISERKKAEEEQRKLHKKSLFLSKTANELQRFSFEEDIFDYIGSKIKELAGNCLIVLSSLDENTDEFKIKNSFGNPKILDRINQFIGLDFTSYRSISGKEFVEHYLYADYLKKMNDHDFKKMVVPTLPKGSYIFAKKFFNINEIYIMGLKEQGIVHGSVTIVAYKNSVVENTDVIETFLNQAAVALQRNRAMKNLSEMNKNLEEKVKERTEEIHRLLKQKDEFIHQLGHDLKNPLGPLVNLLPIIDKHTTNEKDKEMLKVTLRNVEYMKNLVKKTLELARLNSPNTVLNLEKINLKDHLDDVIQQNKFLFEQKQISVTSDLSSDLTAAVDILRFEELVNNLLSNAVKYSDEYGLIVINGFVKEDMITISVQDDGKGMTSDQLDHVFDEFYKADESRHNIDSSGLGMPICKRIVEKHGGKIWAESDGPGKGSTFYFTLPVSVNSYDEITGKIDRLIQE